MAFRLLGRRGRPWHNWSRNLSAFPERVFFPETVEDVIAIIATARAQKKKIRVTGTSHSWAPLVPTDDFLIFTAQLKGITVDLSDREKPLVTVSAGTTIAEFNEACRKNGLVLPTNVVPEDFMIAAVATAGCHGTGLRQGIVSDHVERVELIDADGRFRCVNGSCGADVLAAVQLSLGLLGFIWQMTFRVEPAFAVHQVDDAKVDMESAIDTFEERVLAHDYTQFEWWPFNRYMWIKHYDRTGGVPDTRFCRRCWTQLVQRLKLYAGLGTYTLMMLCPRLTPPLMRIMYPVANATDDLIVPAEWAIHYQAGLRIIRATNMEVAFPAGEHFENVKRAWRVVVRKTRDYQARGSYPFNQAMIARFVDGSRVPLSPAYGHGVMCFIEIVTYADTPEWVEFSTEVMSEWLRIPHARPHWAKESRQFPPAAIRAAYGDDLKEFIRVRDRLGADNHNLFVNDHLESVFLPGDAS